VFELESKTDIDTDIFKIFLPIFVWPVSDTRYESAKQDMKIISKKYWQQLMKNFVEQIAIKFGGLHLINSTGRKWGCKGCSVSSSKNFLSKIDDIWAKLVGFGQN